MDAQATVVAAVCVRRAPHAAVASLLYSVMQFWILMMMPTMMMAAVAGKATSQAAVSCRLRHERNVCHR
jgi:hypothetical protein